MSALTSIQGLSSGLNTDEIITAILTAERRPAVLLEEQQTLKTNMVTTFRAFQAKLLALGTETRALSRRATFDAFSVTSSDDTIVSASAVGRVASGTYDVQVLSLARNHQLASQGFADQSASSLGTGTITIGLGNGTTRQITITSANNSLVGLRQAINDAKVGVTATIINDGTSSRPYRLLLTGDKTGQASRITFDSSLTGGTAVNLSSGSFDSPEHVMRNSASTSQVSLGATAAYTGTTNKTYTFTVDGSGAQTVGGAITLNWSDGTNSGSVIVSQADAEVSLAGAGADGLTIRLSAGAVYGGDQFQVQTFAPLLQDATDAKIAFGGSSPITVTSATNQFTNVIGGLTLNVKKLTETGKSISLKADLDTSAIRGKIQSVIDKINDLNEFVDKQNSYNVDTKESGTLFGEPTLQTIQASLRSTLSSKVPGLTGAYTQLAALGIRTGLDGRLIIRDSARLDKALREDLDSVVDLFTSSGRSSSSYVEYVSSTEKTKVGTGYTVNITQAATKGRLDGSGIADPASTPLTLTNSNNRLKLTVDSVTSNEIILNEGTYSSTSALITELQSKIDADSRLGSKDVTVTWVSTGTNTGYVSIESSTYGRGSKVEIGVGVANSVFATLGLASGTAHTGTDVAGTINGETAEGSGQYLTGKSGNKTTEGLKLLVTLPASGVTGETEGTISLSKGIGARISDLLETYNKTGDGLVDRRIKGYEGQVTDLKKQIEAFDTRLASRRASLQKQFYAMEQALGQLGAISDYLTGQITNMNQNWNFRSNNNR